MKIVISVYLTYHQYDTIYLVFHLDQAEQNIVWLSIFQLMVKLGCDNRSKQKSYCKSDDPHWCLQEYCKLCVFFTGALISISMSKRTPNYTTFYTHPSWISQQVQQWAPFAWVRFSQTLVYFPLLHSAFCNVWCKVSPHTLTPEFDISAVFSCEASSTFRNLTDWLADTQLAL